MGEAAHVIRIADFETSGLGPPAEVVEVGVCDLTRTADGWQVGEPSSWLCGVDVIPPEVRAVHHITMAECAGQPTFNRLSFLESADTCAALAAHSMDFENSWLQADGLTPLICTLKAALRVWPQAPSHSNGAIRYWLEDQGLLSLDATLATPAHRAGPDSYVTAHILKALFAAGATGREMVAWTREPRVLPRCPIGDPWRGKPWAEVDGGFLRWMVDKPVEPDLVWNARREIDRRRDGQAGVR